MTHLLDDNLDDSMYEDNDPDERFGYTPDLDAALEVANEDSATRAMKCSDSECGRIFIVGKAYDIHSEDADLCPRCRTMLMNLRERLTRESSRKAA